MIKQLLASVLAAGLCLSVQFANAAVPGGSALAGLILDEFDSNLDGKITSKEWQTGVTDGFDYLDDNGNGTLTPGELDGLQRTLAKRIGNLSAGVVTKLVKTVVLSLDKDKSGSVSRAEYDASASGMFRKLDTDKNKNLSEAELANLPLRLIGG